MRGETFMPYMLIIPSLLVMGILTFYPVSKVFVLSFQNYNLTRLFEEGYIGLTNFKTIFFEDDLFYHTLWVSFKWVSTQVSLQLVFGLLIAVLLNRKFKGRGLARAIVFAPWAVSGVMTSILFILIFNQHFGVLNYALKDLGLAQDAIAWTANAKTVFPSIVIADLWRGIPFFAITLLAALQTIPKDVYESCEVDGCGRFRTFFSITLPYLKETIVFTTLLRTIWEFNSIDLIFNMTGGGPMHLTTTLTLYMMKTSIIAGNYGYGSALATVGFCILLVFATIYLYLNKFGRGIYD
jgi:multiple sugar transport system permease protein